MCAIPIYMSRGTMLSGQSGCNWTNEEEQTVLRYSSNMDLTPGATQRLLLSSLSLPGTRGGWYWYF